MSDPVVEVVDLVKEYPAPGGSVRRAVDSVSLTVLAGRTTALVGESGAGKSTVGAVLSGLTSATSGRVVVCGEERGVAARAAADRRRRGGQLQLVPQDPFQTLDPRQRVGEAIAEAISLDRRSTRTEVVELLERVGLSERHAGLRPRNLSGGQRQRVAIARALAPRPSVLILDEAVSALDVSVQAQVLNLLAEVQRELGTAYLFITHDLGVVRQLADDVVVLRDGRVVENGTADDVLVRPQDDYTRVLVDSTPRPGWRPVHRTRR